MLFEIAKAYKGFSVSQKKLVVRPPSELGLFESDIEQWLTDRPDLLLPNEQLLIIARSISGKSMADILALDALGRLVIVEIKRDWSDRYTVAQLLEYAASLRSATFEQLQDYARRYKGEANLDLYKRYQEFYDGSSLQREQLGKEHRVFIVAPDSDSSLRAIVEWLQSFKVPIDFVPFSVYADEAGTPCYLQLEGVISSPEVTTTSDVWLGHWIFNTNETYAQGAYHRMFDKNVAAIFGYPNGSANLEGSVAGNKVFAYVNRQGLRAVGTVLDGQVRSGNGIFLNNGQQEPDEYHLDVRWEVAPAERAISSADAYTRFNYNLPVRSVFAKLKRGNLASRLEQELHLRASTA